MAAVVAPAVPSQKSLVAIGVAHAQLESAISSGAFNITPTTLKGIREIATRLIMLPDDGKNPDASLRDQGLATFQRSFEYEIAKVKAASEDQADDLRDQIKDLRNQSVCSLACQRTTNACKSALWFVGKTALIAGAVAGAAYAGHALYMNPNFVQQLF